MCVFVFDLRLAALRSSSSLWLQYILLIELQLECSSEQESWHQLCWVLFCGAFVNKSSLIHAFTQKTLTHQFIQYNTNQWMVHVIHFHRKWHQYIRLLIRNILRALSSLNAYSIDTVQVHFTHVKPTHNKTCQLAIIRKKNHILIDLQQLSTDWRFD